MSCFFCATSIIKRLLPALLALFIVACANVLPASDPNDFIDASEYDRLSLVSTQPGIKVYRYLSPEYKRTDYKAVMVDPIVLYQSAEKDLGKTGISEETIYKIRNAMDISMRQMVRKQLGISYKPGRRVARLSTAVTGVIIDGDAFRPKRLVPISTVLKSAGQKSTIAGGRAQLMVEAKLIDSVTGKLLGDGVYLVSREQFRLEVDSPEKFQTLASQWVRQAVSVATGLR